MSKTYKEMEREILGLNKIHLGDSLELIKELPDNCVDLIVTDPPYIVDTTAPSKNSRLKISKLYSEDIAEIGSGFDIEAHFAEWNRVCKKFNAFVFCSNKQISDLMKWGESMGYVTTCLIWHKTAAPLCNGNWISDVEYCIHIRQKGATFQGNFKLKSKVHREPSVRSEFDHPTVKPLELIKKHIRIGSNENDVILDPFMGSGTTANACIQLDRQFIGYELNEKYHKMACERVERAKGNFGLFEGL